MDKERTQFLDALNLPPGVTHSIRRERVFEDVLHLYKNDHPADFHPLTTDFVGEMACDLGGVTRDMFSAFWESAYERLFDGSTLLSPVLHANVDMTQLSTVGAILSHGFLSSGFLPLRVAFPVLLLMLHGPTTEIPPQLLVEAFIDSVSYHDSQVLKDALSPGVHEFTSESVTGLLGILSRFGCRDLPTRNNLRQQLLQMAKFEFVTKPFAAIASMHQGVPQQHRSFWESMSIQAFWELYLALGVTASKVIQLLDEPLCLTSNQSRVFGYLVQMIGNMKQDELRSFLRFVTCSSVCLSGRLAVRFNSVWFGT